MTILIKGIKTPKTCQICRATGFDRIVDCSLWQHVRSISLDKHRNCPLIPVPTPHDRLIDVAALYKITCGMDDSVDVLNAILEAPTIIEVEE